MRIIQLSLLAVGILLIASSGVGFAADSASLSKTLSEQAGIPPEQAKEQIKLVFSAIEAELKAGHEVTIRRFGRFYVQQRAPREGRNPATGKKIQIPAKRYPRFSSSDVLKDSLNAG